MTNTISDHPLTRRVLLDRLRGIRRMLKKVRTGLDRKGEIPSQRRRQLMGMTEVALRSLGKAWRDLDAARPRRRNSGNRPRN